MITLDDLRSATSADVLALGTRTSFGGFAHDSRTVAPGDCFVAVRGMHGDGHDYALDAVQHGAGAVLLERARLAQIAATQPDLVERLRSAGACVLVVVETRAALRQYAAAVLRAWRPTVVAVTGSAGKTTTKEAIADVLGLLAPTFRSWRNYNDLLGLPLSLGALDPSHRFAVVELGADHPGEIRELAALVQPTVSVVTNVSASDMQYFGSVAALAEELAELPAALPADGWAVLDHGDARVQAMAGQTQAHVRFFGARSPDDPQRLQAGSSGYRRLPLGSREPLALALQPLAPTGRRRAGEPVVFPHLHADTWAFAVLAALTVGEALGVAQTDALAALRSLCPLPGRMRWHEGGDGLIVLDDSHNAIPASASAGLAALAAIGRARGGAARIAVLGDMLRLGDQEEEAHRALGREVVATADYLVTQGLRAEWIAQEAQRSGMDSSRIAVTHTAEDAVRAVRSFAGERALGEPSATPRAIAYCKGSPELRMEQVVAPLLAHPERAEEVLDRQTHLWRRIVVTRPDRPTWLEIDLAAIGRNTRLVKRLIGPDVQLLVSLKADAYGHGALRVARTVLNNGATWLGVATVSEAEPLRAAGVTAPMLVFGYTAPWQAREAVRLDLRATVYGLEAAQALSVAARDLGREVRVHLKVDTGMARLGVRAEDVAGVVALCERLHELPGVVVEGIFTHFATADSADQTYAHRQLERFEVVLAALDARGLRPPLVHAANSAATLTLPEAHYSLVRPGVAIYGLAPSDEVRLPEGFRPALAFKTQVAQVKEVPAGEGISYGATYVTERPTRIAILPVGYADGFRRGPTNWGEVLVRGQRAPILGRVTMDQSIVDVTAIAGVRQGDEVVLIGRQGDDELTAEAVAARLGTISYEVVAELLARVPRIS